MLLRLVPTPPFPTVLFTLAFPQLPDDLPLPASWALTVDLLQTHDLPPPPSAATNASASASASARDIYHASHHHAQAQGQGYLYGSAPGVNGVSVPSKRRSTRRGGGVGVNGDEWDDAAVGLGKRRRVGGWDDDGSVSVYFVFFFSVFPSSFLLVIIRPVFALRLSSS